MACRAAAAAAALCAAAAAAPPRTITIAPGVRMPRILLGTCCGSDPDVGLVPWLRAGGVGVALDSAVDTNYSEFAGCVARNRVPREQLFISAKVEAEGGDALAAVRDIVSSLRVASVDLVTMDVAYDDAKNAAQWRRMELALAGNLTRSIGIANSRAPQIDELMRSVTVPPAVVQNWMSLGSPDDDAIATAHRHGIVYSAYHVMKGCPIGDPSLARVAAARGKTEAQVCLRYVLQRAAGALTVGTGSDPATTGAYAADDLGVLGFALTDEEMAALLGGGGGGGERCGAGCAATLGGVGAGLVICCAVAACVCRRECRGDSGEREALAPSAPEEPPLVRRERAPSPAASSVSSLVGGLRPGKWRLRVNEMNLDVSVYPRGGGAATPPGARAPGPGAPQPPQSPEEALPRLPEDFAPPVVPKDAATSARLRSAVAAHPLLAAVRDSDVVVGAMVEERFRPGEAVLAEGRRGTGRFYLISEGEAEVTREGALLTTLGPGLAFGEVELLCPGPCTATVRAATPLSTFSLDRDTYRLHVVMQASRGQGGHPNSPWGAAAATPQDCNDTAGAPPLPSGC